MPGSKPLIMPTGGSAEVQEVEVVKQDISLAMTCDDFDYNLIVQALASRYEVDASLISFVDPCASAGRRRGRKLLAAGLTITIEISTPVTSPSGAASATSAADILSAMNTVSPTDLASSISSALGTVVNVTKSTALQTTEERVVTVTCPRGKWCTAGLIVDCDVGECGQLTGLIFFLFLPIEYTRNSRCALRRHIQQRDGPDVCDRVQALPGELRHVWNGCAV